MGIESVATEQRVYDFIWCQACKQLLRTCSLFLMNVKFCGANPLWHTITIRLRERSTRLIHHSVRFLFSFLIAERIGWARKDRPVAKLKNVSSQTGEIWPDSTTRTLRFASNPFVIRLICFHWSNTLCLKYYMFSINFLSNKLKTKWKWIRRNDVRNFACHFFACVSLLDNSPRIVNRNPLWMAEYTHNKVELVSGEFTIYRANIEILCVQSWEVNHMRLLYATLRFSFFFFCIFRMSHVLCRQSIVYVRIFEKVIWKMAADCTKCQSHRHSDGVARSSRRIRHTISSERYVSIWIRSANLVEMSHSPLDKIQALDAIEKEIINCMQSAGEHIRSNQRRSWWPQLISDHFSGQALHELGKEKTSQKAAENHTQQFLKSLNLVESKLSEQINYLTQVSTGQPHEGSGYASAKVLQMAWHRIQHARSRVRELDDSKNKYMQAASRQQQSRQANAPSAAVNTATPANSTAATNSTQSSSGS